MQRLLIVAEELKNMGFDTKIILKNMCVKVTLKNRKPSKMEVETALEQIFDEIKFNLITSFDGIIIVL